MARDIEGPDVGNSKTGSLGSNPGDSTARDIEGPAAGNSGSTMIRDTEESTAKKLERLIG
jgi:hypothetical protein